MYLLTGRPAVVRMTVSSVGEKMRLFAACAALNLDSTREGKDSESPSDIMLYETLHKSLVVRTLDGLTWIGTHGSHRGYSGYGGVLFSKITGKILNLNVGDRGYDGRLLPPS